MPGFAAQLSAWVDDTKERMHLVFQESVQDVVEEMQSRVPVDTGRLRASLAASTSAMPQAHPAKDEPGRTYTYDASEVGAVIAGSKPGDTIFVGYTVDYAKFAEFGSRKRSGHAMMRLAAQQWPTIVDRNARRLVTTTAPKERG